MTNEEHIVAEVERRKLVLECWMEDFKAFIRDGTGSPEFLAYMDSDRKCQEAVDLAFNVLSTRLQRLAQAWDRYCRTKKR